MEEAVKAVEPPLAGPTSTEPEEEELLGEANGPPSEEARQLLAQLASEQAEVAALRDASTVQLDELRQLKQNLQSELEELQAEQWKMQMFSELEELKQQLGAVHKLEAEMRAAEDATTTSSTSEAADGPSRAALAADTLMAQLLCRAAVAGDGAEEEEEESEADEDSLDYDEEETGLEGADEATLLAMQAELDAELASMFSRLQTVRSEANQVAAQKLALEKEMLEMLKQEAAMMGVDVEEALAAGLAAADEEEALEAAAGAPQPALPA